MKQDRQRGDGNRNRSYDGGDRSSFNDRSYRNDHSKGERSFRNHSPPMRSRDRDGHSGSRQQHTSGGAGGGYRSNDTSRSRNMSPPMQRNRSDYKTSTSSNIKSRLAPLRPTMRSTARRIVPTSAGRIIRRNDLRSGLINKRTGPINRAKDYAKKIREARMKLTESSSTTSSTRLKSTIEAKSPKKDSDDRKHDEIDEDFLAIANDINFDEDENESTGGKHSTVKDDDKSKEVKQETVGDEDEKKQDVKSLNESSKDDKEKEGRSSRHQHKPSQSRSRTPSKERGRKFEIIEYICIHCGMRSTSAQVSYHQVKFHQHAPTKLLNMNLGISFTFESSSTFERYETCRIESSYNFESLA